VRRLLDRRSGLGKRLDGLLVKESEVGVDDPVLLFVQVALTLRIASSGLAQDRSAAMSTGQAASRKTPVTGSASSWSNTTSWASP